MRVTSSKTIDFPSLGWGINAGEVADLPDDKEAQELILQNAHITKSSSGTSKKSEDGKAEE